MDTYKKTFPLFSISFEKNQKNELCNPLTSYQRGL
jgi:hypothetical protein